MSDFGPVSRFSFWKGRYRTVTHDRYTGARHRYTGYFGTPPVRAKFWGPSLERLIELNPQIYALAPPPWRGLRGGEWLGGK